MKNHLDMFCLRKSAWELLAACFIHFETVKNNGKPLVALASFVAKQGGYEVICTWGFYFILILHKLSDQFFQPQKPKLYKNL